MAHQDWLPALWKQALDDDDAFSSFRKQFGTLFSDFDKDIAEGDAGLRIHSNVSETEKDVRITAELPGLTEQDVDVSVVGDRITIKGEKKSEKDEKSDEKGREFHRIERRSGSFRRTMRLPFVIDADKVSATVKNGVLTVSVPKPEKLVEQTRKIAVSHE